MFPGILERKNRSEFASRCLLIEFKGFFAAVFELSAAKK